MATLHSQLVIVGGGPAALTSAIYAARASLHPVVLNGERIGGQLARSDDVEDFPGFVEGIGGRRLIELCARQAARFGAEICFERAVEIDVVGRPFVVTTNEDRRIACDALILAHGASSRRLGVPGEERLRGRGLYVQTVGNAARHPGRPAVVVGGGDAAAEAALYASRFASKVIIVHRRNQLRASAIFQRRLARSNKIQVAWSSVVSEISGDERVESVVISEIDSNIRREIPAGSVYVCIGQDPNTALVQGQIQTDRAGYIAVEPKSCRTSVDGVFACGEIMDPSYRQAVTAAGTGCMAAIDAERYLTSAMIAAESEAEDSEPVLTALDDVGLGVESDEISEVTARVEAPFGEMVGAPPVREKLSKAPEDMAEELLHEATGDR